MDVNYELYKVFLSVAKHLSFTKASNDLSTTQSAVSQSISKLENILGDKLFSREGSKISLTKRGEMLKEYIEKGEFYFASAFTYFTDEKENVFKINIATADVYNSCFVSPLIKKYADKHKNVSFNILSKSDSKFRVTTVETGQTDFAISDEIDSKYSTNLEIKLFKKLNYTFVYNPSFFNFERGIELDELLKNYHILIQPANSRPRQYFDDIINTTYPRRYSEFYHVDGMLESVQNGLGVGFAPLELVRNRNIVAIKNLPVKTVDIMLLYKKANEKLAKDVFKIK